MRAARTPRPLDLDWVRSLRDQCAAADAAFFFKQAGSVLARQWGAGIAKASDPGEWPEPFPQQWPAPTRPGARR